MLLQMKDLIFSIMHLHLSTSHLIISKMNTLSISKIKRVNKNKEQQKTKKWKKISFLKHQLKKILQL
jgi:hypothetical protein